MDIQKRTRIQRDQLADMLENVNSTMDVQRQAALELLDTVKQSHDEEIDVEARAIVERRLHEAGIIEDPDIDGGIIG